MPYWGEGQIHLSGLKRMIEAQRSVGAITGEVDYSKIIDTRFLPRRPQGDAIAARAESPVTARRSGSHNVGKTFMTGRPPAPLHAVGPIDFEIRQGEFFAVVGPSGCGKSTLLELIAGLTPATEGTLEFEGQPIAGEAPEGIGVVFQEDASLRLARRRGQRRVRPAPRRT